MNIFIAIWATSVDIAQAPAGENMNKFKNR